MATLTFCDFDDALEAIKVASSNDAIVCIVEQIDQQFNAGTLEVSPTQWAHLASAVAVYRYWPTPTDVVGARKPL